jgi:hypothetical protein
MDLIDQKFRRIATEERPWSSPAAWSFAGSALLFLGVGGIAVCLPLLVVAIASAAMGLPQRGFPMPYGVATPFFGSLGSALIASAGSLVSGEHPPRHWLIGPLLRAIFQTAGVFGAILAVSTTAIAFTWNRFGVLAATPFRLIFPLGLLALSLALLTGTAGPPLREDGSRPAVVLAGRLLTHIGWSVLILSLLLFAAELGLVMTFRVEKWAADLTVVGALIGPIAVVCGLILTSPRKKLVLFLRRFGNEDINLSIRRAVRWRLGTTYRLITLDDLAFRPASSPPGPKAVAAGTIIAAAALALLTERAIEWVLEVVKTGEAVQTNVWVPGSIDGMEGWYFEIFLYWVGKGAFLVECYIVGLGALVAIGILFLGRRSRLSIENVGRIRKVERQAERLKSWWRGPSLFAPQASVVKVVDALWQPTVVSLLGHAEAVLIDISVPSESILWELRAAREASTSKLILLAQTDRLIEWIGQLWPAGSTQSELLAAACGLSLIIYSTPDRLDMVALAAALSDQPLSGANRPRKFDVPGPRTAEIYATELEGANSVAEAGFARAFAPPQ